MGVNSQWIPILTLTLFCPLMAGRRQANELMSPGTKWPKWGCLAIPEAEVLACPSLSVDQGLPQRGRAWETEHRFSILY